MLFGAKKVTVSTDEAKVDELLSRGVEKIVGGDLLREKLLKGEQLRVKLGIDPTSPDIHLGRATQLLKLRDFQDLGHHIVFIVGDATGVIGDTSDKDSERPMLSRKEVEKNAEAYFDQAGKILDMSRVEKVYNSKWLDALTFSEIGRQANAFSVADFISRDNIKKRLDEGKRVSLREVLYPLMQGYDSVVVKSDVEIGGTDQWFNLLAGRVLQEEYGQDPQFVMTSPLIAGLDGRKMSSSWGNTIILNAEPSDMYGKVMSLNDELVKDYFEVCTRVPMSEVREIVYGNPKEAKMRLAFEIVKLIYSDSDAESAQNNFEETFSKGNVPKDIKVVKASGRTLVEILLEENIIASKKEMRRLVDEGAITNITTGKKIDNIDTVMEELSEIKIGKKRFIKIEV